MQKLLKQITEKKKIIIPVLAGVALLGWFGWYLWHWEHREPLLEVHFFDVEKGSAVFLRTPSGKTALIGGGQGSDIIRNLTDVMPFYERKIDTVIYPIDPMSGVGLADVVGRYDVVETIRVASSSEQTRFVLDEVRGTGNIVGAPVILESLVIGTTSGALLKLTHGGNSFIIADSISRKDQQIYAIGTGETRADVLQLRSAAKTKMSTSFFNEIHPKYVVVSKMPTRPKVTAVTAKSLATSTKIVQPVATTAVKVAKSKKPSKSQQKKPPQKPSPPKDPVFNIYSYSALKILALDRAGTVEFLSDGKSLRLVRK